MFEVRKKHYCVVFGVLCFLNAIFDLVHYVSSSFYSTLYLRILVLVLPYLRRMLKLMNFPRLSAITHNKRKT